jgi:hypothetical protein
MKNIKFAFFAKTSAFAPQTALYMLMQKADWNLEEGIK